MVDVISRRREIASSSLCVKVNRGNEERTGHLRGSLLDKRSPIASEVSLLEGRNTQEPRSDILQEYGNKMNDLSKKIVAILLNCLGDGFETKYSESEFGRCYGYLRINNYSPPNNDQLEEIEGLGMHTDMSCITVLYQDEIGGLQVRSRRGEWMDITPSEGTLVVNIGDLLQAWSNGRLRSSEHRVVLKKCASRLSMAFFWCFEDEKVISAPEDVVGEEGKQRIYTPFVCQDYVKFRENNEKGRFDKVGYTVDDFVATMTRSSGSKEALPKRSVSL